MLGPLLLSLSALATPDRGYIQADVLRVRSSASARSRVVGRLPINTRVSVLGANGERVRVQSEAQPDLIGWIDAGYLGEDALTVEGALAASEAADDIAESVVWVERALAIAPTEAVKDRATLLMTDLDDDEAAQLSQRVAAASVSWFAWCDGGEATLLGRMDGRTWVSALDVYPTLGEAQQWERTMPGGLDAIAFSSGYSQTHFPSPGLTEMIEIENDDDSTTGDVVVLGRCSEPGLMASPAAQLEVIRKSSHSGSLYNTEPVEIAGVEYAQRVDEHLVEGYRTTMKPFYSCGGDAEVRPAIEVGIFDTEGNALRPFGQQKDTDVGYAPFSVTHPSWLRIRIDGEPTTVFTAGEGHDLSSAAWMVFINPDGTTDARQMITRQYGC